MKNLTNILSYLWLLLLMAVTACSDLEEEVGPMQGEEEVELTIQLHVPDMQASTRAQMEITEKISTIVAIAFDESGALIKKVDAILSDQDHESHSGTLKIKVPKRTQTIHFLGNYTKDDIGSIKSLETLNSFTTTDADATTMPTMRYWGKAEYNEGNNLSVTLYRNMAKLTLKKGEGFTANSCYIAGFVNRNLSGTIVPSGYQVGDTPTIPNNVQTGTYQADNSLGNVYYLFEHANVENNNPLYVIIEVAAKYYKVAFAAGDEYFPIIRNHEYTITIDGIDAMYAENNYTDAVNSQYPINDLVITSVPMTVTPDPAEVQNESGQTFTVTVTIPEGITELNVPTHDAFDITPPSSLTPQNGKYTVTQGSYEFTFTVKDGVEAGNKTISFSGRGKYKSATGSTTVTLTPPVVVQDQDMYEIWVNNNAWIGNNDADVAFFGYAGQNFNTGTSNSLESTFYDASADSHKSQAMVMGSDDSFTFTITGTEPRYLTLLVARNGNAPSIDLQKDGEAWTATSDDEQVPDTYNFSKDGDITTSGRLIRYTLPAGTYTLQRGNNDYLLYYMRVTKDKPTMTDIVQPSAAHYNLSWTGGEYGNSLKNGTKYYVDDDATIFTPKLTYLGLSEMPLTTTSVTVVTDTLYFQDNAQNVSGTTIIKNTETKSYNGSNPTLEFNAGTYNNLCGTIENIAETSYKYMAFYDAIQLKEVSGIEVRNTIKVGLYDDWYSTEALDHYTEGQLMMTGFKMPTHTIPVPVDVEAGTVESIDFSVSGGEWVRKNSGLGIDFNNAPNYSLTTQDETNGGGMMRTHPRPEWIYRIEWENVTAESMTVSITDTDNNSDAYFSHGEQIGKSVTILTPVENTPLDIDLDFYADLDNNSQIADSENRSDNRYEDLQLGTTRFYLKATISYEDSEKYNNETVQLQGEFNSPNSYSWANANGAIHWDFSKNGVDKYSDDNDDIRYYGNDHNGTGLEFTIQDGKTEYLIDWVFVTGGHYSGGDIAFTYTISNVDDKNYNITGDTQATIAFTNEPVIYCNFNDGLDGFTHNGQGSVSSNNGTLILNNGEDRANAYDAQAMYETDKIQYRATYTLSFKVKIADGTTGGLVVAIQRFVDNNTNYTYYYQGKTINDIINIINAAQKDDQGWAEIVFESNMYITNEDDTNNPTHFMFNFGDLVGTLYIDDVKLVKN